MLYMDFEAQGLGSTFTFRHTLLKKAILEGKTCNGRFILQGTVCTQKSKSNGPIALLWSKIAFFKRAWRKVKVLSCPWALGSKLPLIRALKLGTLRLWTPTGFKMASRQSWKNEKTSVLLVKQTFSLIFQLWRLTILKPFGVQRRNVPHFKGLIILNLDFEAQGRGRG